VLGSAGWPHGGGLSVVRLPPLTHVLGRLLFYSTHRAGPTHAAVRYKSNKIYWLAPWWSVVVPLGPRQQGSWLLCAAQVMGRSTYGQLVIWFATHNSASVSARPPMRPLQPGT
jgi:hypothetical protein